MKVVVSIGGSVLAPDLDADRVAGFAAAIEDVYESGTPVGVVTGGGPVAREYIETSRELDANEIELDEIGIAVTRLNARLLIAALDDEYAPSAPSETYEDGHEVMHRGDVPVLGGTVAGQTTDAVSAAFAEFVDADLLVYATSVDGVYDADPRTDSAATKFETLSADELVDLIVDIEMRAGSNAPVDLLAAKLIQRSGLRAVVLDGTEPSRVAAAVEGEHAGTEIVPPGA